MLAPVRHFALALCLVTAACGDDGGTAAPDAGPGGDVDAGGDDDVDAGPVAMTPIVTPMSAAGSDQFFGVAFAADGTFYAVGYAADDVAGGADRSILVARFRADGELDPTFGGSEFAAPGVVRVNLAPGGRNHEIARSVVVQSTGKVVIGGTIDHDVDAEGLLADDRDIFLARLDDTGALDADFGDGGVRVIDLNDAVVAGEALAAPDNLWSLTLAGDDAIIVHGNQRRDAVGEVTDTDWAMLRLTADGELDEEFADDGVFTLDLQEVNGNARAAIVLGDGSIIGSGYANTPGLGSTQAVLYKLTAEGELDDGFGVGGIFHQVVLSSVTEAYGVVAVGDKLVTTGYGKQIADAPNDVVSLRVTAGGELDPSWGEDGAAVIDVAALNDQSRTLLALPDGRVLLVGAGTAAADAGDAMLVLLDEDGAPDPRFASDGRMLFDLGGPSDHFWGAALSPSGDRAVVVGVRGAGMGATAENNDDAAILVVPLE